MAEQNGTKRVVPEIPQWVAQLRGDEKAEYDTARAENIAEMSAAVIALFQSQGEFGDVSPDAVSRMALRLATARRDSFEEGMQIGMEIRDDEYAHERSRMHSVEIARLGGHG